MTVTAKFTPKYFVSGSALAKYLQIALAIVVSIFASKSACYKNYFEANNQECQSVFDSRSDLHGQAFVVVAGAVMAVETFVIFLVRLFDINNIDYATNWRTIELFFNGLGFSVFALIGALEVWYVTGYYAGTDYISQLGVQTAWIVATACGFANALLHLLVMIVVGVQRPKD